VQDHHKAKMVTLLLSLCVVTVIQLTSSQPTFDVIQRDSCEHSELQQDVAELKAVIGHNAQMLSQLQKDMAELKAAIGHKTTKGKLTW